MTDESRILEEIRACESEIVETYRTLHSMPEGPFEEHRTSAYIADRLVAAGFRVESGVAETGVVATLGRLTQPVVALRADMDALEHEVDGKKVFIHSCGHDAHSTMVLWAGEILARCYPRAREHLKLIFQPAEETGLGARRMAEAGAVDDVAVLLGIHLRPAAECPLGKATPCLQHSASLTVRYKVTGKAAHSGRPHFGVNAADAVAASVLAVNSIKPDPLLCATVNVVSLEAGLGPAGIIPESGTMVVNIRAENDGVAFELLKRVDSAVLHAASANGAVAKKVSVKHTPGAAYDPGTVAAVKRAISKVLGEPGAIDRITTPGAEDFHSYRQYKPQLKTAYVGLGADLTPGLHDPRCDFNLKALALGVAVLGLSVIELACGPGA
ncbi:MAG: amidohydrolase [Bacillota bacterium]|jgi:amidohydrolase|nr:amidohydrolase [Bacillota bacterium]